jgi:hypothetical protein
MFNFCNIEYEKKVTFDNNLHIYLIPSINDLIKFKNDLWWTIEEMDEIKTNFMNDINLITKFYSINKKDAFLILYNRIKND